MNKEVIFNGEKAEVTNELGEKRNIEISNNMFSILEIENMIEVLEKIVEEINTTGKRDKQKEKRSSYLCKLGVCIFYVISIYLGKVMFTNNIILLIYTMLLTIMTIISTKSFDNVIKREELIENSKEQVISYLNSKLTEQKAKLQELKENEKKINYHVEDNTKVAIDNKEIVNCYDEANLCFLANYNNKLKKYYAKTGKLPEEYYKTYDYHERDLLVKFLDDNVTLKRVK